ncbi:hypothetical protein OH76DRAFT_1424302, partial [Lentinus brumalis]
MAGWNSKTTSWWTKRRSKAQREQLANNHRKLHGLNKENIDSGQPNQGLTNRLREVLAIEREKIKQSRCEIRNGRRREKRGRDAVSQMRSTLARLTEEKDGLANKVAEQEAALQAVHVHHEKSLQEVARDAHVSVAAENTRAWEQARAATQLVGQIASAAIAKANARADNAVSEKERYQKEVADLKEEARLTVDWAVRTVEATRAQTVYEVAAAEKRLRDALKVLEVLNLLCIHYETMWLPGFSFVQYIP